MDGGPGVGKTPLRELRGHTAASLSDLIKADDFEQHERERIIKHIKNTYGSGVIFIFDGFDELGGKQRSYRLEDGHKDWVSARKLEGETMLTCNCKYSIPYVPRSLVAHKNVYAS